MVSSSSSQSTLPLRHVRSDTSNSLATLDSQRTLIHHTSPTNSTPTPHRRAGSRTQSRGNRYSQGTRRRIPTRDSNNWKNATVISSTVTIIWTTYSLIRYFVAITVYSTDSLRRRINLTFALIHVLCLISLLLYLYICIWMRRSSLTLHFCSLAASAALLFSSVTNLLFTILWHHPNGPFSSPQRTAQGRCQFDFDIFWTGTGGACFPGIRWGYLFAGAFMRMILTTIIPCIMHVAVWKWTYSSREIHSPRGVYTSVNTSQSPSGVAMTEIKWLSERKSSRPQPLNLNASTRHSRNLSGGSTASVETVSTGERPPTPTAEQLKEWAAQYHANLRQSEEFGGGMSSIQFGTCETLSPRNDEFGDHTFAHENPNIRLGRIPGIVHRLSTIESASEGGISRASTFGRVTPSAGGHISINGWTNEFGVTREGSHGTVGTDGSSSSVDVVRRMDSFVSAFSYLQSPSSSHSSPLQPRFPERAATTDSLGSSSTRTEYFNALTDVEESEP